MLANPLSLPAGSLRHSIEIQSRSTTPDSFGQPIATWSTVLTPRASIDILTQRELYQADQLSGQVSHVITIRWPGILVQIVPGMQVVFGSHTYRIQTVDNVELRSRVVRLYVQELNGGAA